MSDPGERTPEADSSAPRDEALMARVGAGDEAAFAELMHRWERPVKAVIGRMVLNTAEADDLAQETFVRLWQQRDRFRAGAAFRPWILTLALNLARNRLRWWRRRPVVSLDAWTEVAGDSAADPSADAAGALEASERAAFVRDAVAALPRDLREALVLFEYEGVAQAEIAIIVGASPKAVETRIHRARERLRGVLGVASR